MHALKLYYFYFTRAEYFSLRRSHRQRLRCRPTV